VDTLNADTSQYGEAAYILDRFAGRTGRFLDIGAFDGKTFSNTWPLAELGWSGVCVEPSPPAFCHLMRTYEGNDRVTLINAAIAPTSALPDAFARFKAGPFREILIPRLGWIDLYAALAVRWSPEEFLFVNIDTEGTNAAVLAAMPLRPEMICVEYDPQADGVNTVHNILTGWGYRWTVIGGNVLGVRS
jgi:hypothetical protein